MPELRILRRLFTLACLVILTLVILIPLFRWSNPSVTALPAGEYFPVAEFFGNSHHDHPDAIEQFKLKDRSPVHRTAYYNFRGPKVNQYAPIQIEGTAMHASHPFIADTTFAINSFIEKSRLSKRPGFSIEETIAPIDLGDRQKVYRILFNDAEYGTLVLIKSGKVFYSYKVFGAYLEGEQPWRVGILARIEIVSTL